MPRRITGDNNSSFSDLDWSRGKLLVLDSFDLHNYHSLILTIPKRIIRSSENSRGGISFRYQGLGSEVEDWKIFPTGKALALGSPDCSRGYVRPNYVFINPSSFNPVNVDVALTGANELKSYLEESINFGYYLSCLNSGELIIDEGFSSGSFKNIWRRENPVRFNFNS